MHHEQADWGKSFQRLMASIGSLVYCCPDLKVRWRRRAESSNSPTRSVSRSFSAQFAEWTAHMEVKLRKNDSLAE